MELDGGDGQHDEDGRETAFARNWSTPSTKDWTLTLWVALLRWTPLLVPREARVAFGDLFGRQRRKREQIAVMPVLLDLLLAQHLSIPII